MEVKLREKDGGKEAREERREKEGREETTGLPILETKHHVTVDTVVVSVNLNNTCTLNYNEKFDCQHHHYLHY